MTMLDIDADSLRTLLVDDNVQAKSLTRRILHDIGIRQVFTAKNGVEALSLLGSFEGDAKVDLVLCDWNMPEMDGMELLRQIRTADSDLMFYMITGQSDRSSVSEAKAYGVNGFIKKPFSTDQLSKKIAVATRVVAHRKLQSAASG